MQLPILLNIHTLLNMLGIDPDGAGLLVAASSETAALELIITKRVSDIEDGGVTEIH